ncbi:MAG: CDP-tyvelose-2-epimerase (CDP-paratose 2-epimerase)-like protein [Solirubrobacterales bacterium]|nr:CDP-tyvelose-2-epimerase (CDP-paratose 2-epimerase)-like protein [Solirubrobacterales bacterium]
MNPILITGGAGFVGTNTADRLLRDGRPVRILDDLSRPGVDRNLRWLQRTHGDLLQVETADLRDPKAVRRAVRDATGVFHFAAQVAVTTSLDDPCHDAAVNLAGTLNLLEAARARPRPPAIVFTSTNKVYGSLPDILLEDHEQRYEPADPRLRASGISEDRPLSFCTPYGCSKGAADQYVLDYAASYGLATVVFRMSCIYGPHQFGTEDQGWVAHFLISAVDGRPITIYGDGKQVRDVLYVDDLVDAMMLAQERAPQLAGQAFNIGGGPSSAISLVELIAEITDLRGEQPALTLEPWRKGDQRYYVSDPSRFGEATGWRPRVRPPEGLRRLHDWLCGERAATGAVGSAEEAAA